MNNSISVQDGTGANTKVTFAIRKDDRGKYQAIFAPPDGDGWFWLFAGYHANGKLYVFLPHFEKTKGKGAFAFRGRDLWLGTVSNPLDDPTKWKIEYNPVPFAELGESPKRSSALRYSASRITSSSTVTKRSPASRSASRKLLIARVPANKLADFDSWRFLQMASGKRMRKRRHPRSKSSAARCR